MYHLNEIGIVGAPCGTIQKLTKEIQKGLIHFNIGVMDADHGDMSDPLDFDVAYTDKIGSHQLNYNDEHISYTLRGAFLSCDAVIVNSNHFKADKHIVIINDKKKDSLFRKLDRIDNVIAFVLDDGMSEPFAELKGHLPEFSEIPVFNKENVSNLIGIVDQSIKSNTPPLKGLLLYGGQSSRMGQDKGQIDYHGEPHFQYLIGLLDIHCEDVYVSVAEMQELTTDKKQIVDTFQGLGPFGGILSAFRENPNNAYITLPCDVPFVDESVVQHLISHRDPTKVATCFHNEETGFPEPLITIWEPRAYPRLLHFLSLGYSCPRKVLINSMISEFAPKNKLTLFNANNPEEMDYAKKSLLKKEL